MVVNPKLNLEALDMKQEWTVDGMPVHCDAL